MYTQQDKNSVRYAAALYRSRRKRKNIGYELSAFFAVLIPAFSALFVFLVTRPI